MIQLTSFFFLDPLASFPDKLEKELQAALEEALMLTQLDAAVNAPRDTGALSDSFYRVYRGFNNWQAARTLALLDNPRVVLAIPLDNIEDKLTGAVGSMVSYAAWIEYGTIHYPARPVLGPALMRNSGKIAALTQTAVYQAALKAGFKSL